MEQTNRQLMQIPVKAKRRTAGVSMTKVLARTAGIFLARAIPFGELAPFGIAFLGCERRFGKEAIISAVMSAVGYLTLFDKAVSLKYICCVLAYLLFLYVADRDEGDVSPVASAVAIALIAALAGAVQLVWQEASPWGILQVVADVAMAVSGLLVFERNRGILGGRQSSIFAMSREEKLSFALCMAIVLMGFKGLYVRDFAYSANIIGIWAVAQLALCGGVGPAVVCGTVTGLILGIGGEEEITIALFALSGLVCGGVAGYGKIATALAASAVIGVSVIYWGNDGVIGYLDIPIALIAIIATPEYLWRTIGRISGVRRRENADAGCRDYIKNRLLTVADSFRVLASTFSELSQNPATETEDASIMFDGVAERVCRECSKMSRCWVTEFNTTYQSLYKMLEHMETKGELTPKDAEECFSGRCLRMRKVSGEMNRLFEIYKINCVWKSKLAENRELAGQQLACVSRILDEVSDELYEERVDRSAEEEVRIRLMNRKIRVTELELTTGANGRCYGYIGAIAGEDVQEIRRSAEMALHAIMGVRMTMVGAVRRNGGELLMRFAQPEGYMIEAGFANMSACEENGDNCVMRYLSRGKYVATLSDGMGTGKGASRDSGATVRLLGDFLEAGFDREIAVRLVNSIMVMKSADEAFATVDMCVIDLYSGEAEFIKNGAEPSYIKRGDQTETIRSRTLPVGVVQDMRTESFDHHLSHGDIIVMLSDGLQAKSGQESWIKEMVENADGKMPAQELADRIMDMARLLHSDKSADDMTVMVMKIQER